MNLKSSCLLLLSLLTPCALMAAEAESIVISPNETVLLDENFTDNARNWSNVAIVNGVGEAGTEQAEISDGEWKPSVGADGGGVSSVIDTAFDLSAGSISVYYEAAVGDRRSMSGGRFGIRLNEVEKDKRFVFHIYPGGEGILQYKSSGATTDLKLASSEGVISGGSFTTFKMTISAPSGIDSMGSIETFYYDSTSASYVSLGSIDNAVDLGDGILDNLLIFSRNGLNTDTAANFNRVVVTQFSVK